VTGRLVVVTGTGTGIGKTHVSEALLRALSDSLPRVTGLKPVESGVGGGERTDRERLDAASSFHVQQSGYSFAPPVSPHLAARESGETIEAGVLQSIVARVREQADLTLVELPGGLFTPLSPSLLNVDVVRSLRADFVLLVAPDRLGVLHDVLAATTAAASRGVAFSAIALVEPEIADSSTSRNMLELHMFLPHTPIRGLPRAAVGNLVTHPALVALAREILDSQEGGKTGSSPTS
jgi:dethiobiotin synthetase